VEVEDRPPILGSKLEVNEGSSILRIKIEVNRQARGLAGLSLLLASKLRWRRVWCPN